LSDEALSEIETRANREAAEMLIPKQTMDSFISRTHPFYYTEKIIQFANLIRFIPASSRDSFNIGKKLIGLQTGKCW